MAANTLLQQLSPPPPGLQEATKNSTTAWQADLEALFHHAKDRFPDVVWELVADDEGMGFSITNASNKNGNGDAEEVWGHKAIVYARAPPSFQNRYFSFRSNVAINSSSSTGHLNQPEDSSLSLRLLEDSSNSTHHLGMHLDVLEAGGRTPSPSHTAINSHSHSIRPASPSGPGPSTNLLRLTTSINPSLFADELEYLYTGKGFGEAFEFLFDSSDTRERTLGESPHAGAAGLSSTSTLVHSHSHSRNNSASTNNNGNGNDAESLRIDKLRKDLVFMWRSRLYSDVRIALTGNFGGSGGGHHESTTAIFSSHRFILVSRSPYFYNALIAWPGPGPGKNNNSNNNNNNNNNNNSNNNEPPTLTLPSPPFTPASLHFTLGFIYTGTLIFSHRSYDLQTAFSLLKAALYLSLPTLHDEVQARIVQEMMHGLFHAFLPFSAYEELTRGRWGAGAAGGGCRCRQCARRIPRVLAFSLEEDVKNGCLERGARRGLVGLFGEGWCTPEFASLPAKIRESVLRGVRKRTTAENAFGLLWAAEAALDRLGRVVDPWAEVVKEAVGEGRKGVDELLGRESERCFESEDWMEVMRRASEAEGMVGAFEDSDRVAWVMSSVLRGVKERWAAVVYQTLVSSILLRPHPSDTSAPFLPVTSHVHVQVEQARVELLKWIAKRWLNIRQERGFDELEGWALKEISDHIEVPTDDLLSPPSYSSQKALSSTHTLSNPGSKRNSANPLLRPVSQHPHTSKVDTESDAGASIRVSVLSRSLAAGAEGTSVRSSARSVRTRTVSGESQSTVSAVAVNVNHDSPAKRIVKAVRERERPDSKLTPGLQVDEVDDDDMYVDDEDVDVEDQEEEEEESREGGADEVDETASDIPSVYQTPRTRTRPTTATDISTPASPRTPVPAIQKTLITRASLASVKSSRSGVGVVGATPSPRTRTGSSNVGVSPTTPTADSKSSSKPRSIAPSIRSQAASVTPRTPGSARKNVLSATSTASGSASHYSSALDVGVSRPSSRGSTYSTTGGARAARLTATTPKTRGAGAGSSPTSRPVSRVSTTRSVSGGNRPTSTATTATETSTSTYRTAPGPGGSSTTLNTPSQRPRKTSAASTISVRTAGAGPAGRRSAAGSPVSMSTSRTRKVSTASVASVASNLSTRANAGAGVKLPQKKAVDPTKLSPTTTTTTRAGAGGGKVQATGSAGSVKSSVSSTSVKKSPVTNSTSTTTTGAPPGVRTRTLSAKKSIESMSLKAKKKKGEESAVVVVPVPVPPLPQPQVRRQEEEGVGVEGEVEMGSPSPTEPAPAVPSKDDGSSKDEGEVVEEEQGYPTSPMDESPIGDGEDVGDVTILHSTSTSVSENQNAAENKEGGEKEEEEAEAEAENADAFSAADTSYTTTASTMTVRQKVYSIERQFQQQEHNEHKKTSSSASSSSVATLRRKGSSDTIRTVKSKSSGGGGGGGGEGMGTMTSPPLPPLPLLNSPMMMAKKSQSSLVQSSSPSPSTSQKALPSQESQPTLGLPSVSSPPPPSSSSLPTSAPAPAPAPAPAQQQPQQQLTLPLPPTNPTGATLEIGIPCIISSKRRRFKAYARYIGEVAGEYGEWVGVEVPMPEGGLSGSGTASEDRAYSGSWNGVGGGNGSVHGGNGGSGSPSGNGATGGGGGADPPDDRQWNDGSWCGIRYFEIGGSFGGGAGSEYGGDYPVDERDREKERAARKRRGGGGTGADMSGSGYGYGSSYSSSGGYGYGSSYGYGSATYGYSSKGMLKRDRENDQLSISSDRERLKRMRSVSPAVSDGGGGGMGVETRGLFVRPQQVLYVVDAVGVDF